jgi:hypothetical protein
MKICKGSAPVISFGINTSTSSVRRFSPKKTKSPAKKQGFVEKMGLTSTPLHFARYKLLALNKYYKGCEKQPVLVEKMGLTSTPLHFARHKLLALNKYYKGCEKQPVLVEKMGLEPTTSWLPAKRSSHLSYIPM